MRLMYNKGMVKTICLCLTFLFIALSPVEGQDFDGKAKKGTKECKDKFEYDTENGGAVILSWECAKDLGLGTINTNGTPGTGDDTFDPPAGTPDGNTNGGAITFWKFSSIIICVTGTNMIECCDTLNVWVVKTKTGGNKPFYKKGLLNKKWINGVKACSSGAGSKLIVKWKPGVGPWKLEEPKSTTTEKKDTKTGETKKVVDIEVGGDLGRLSFPMIYGSVFDWTIIPRSIAEKIGLSPIDVINLEDESESTWRGLQSAYMNSTGQVEFEVAELPQLSTMLGPDQSGKVLISNDENSDFGILGGDFMDDYAYSIDPKTGANVLGYLLDMKSTEELETRTQNPAGFAFSPAFPNPFRNNTMINYSLAKDGLLKIVIYDTRGLVVNVLANETMSAGNHAVGWNAKNKVGEAVANGVYYIRFEYNGRMEVQKLLLME